MIKTILFTGAGANYPLGLPTTEILFKKIEKLNDDLKTNKLFKIIKELEGVKDIEDVWSILDNIERFDKINNKVKILENNLFVKLWASRDLEHWSKFIKRVEDLKIIIENIIFKEYIFLPEQENIKKAVNLYKNILNYLLKENINKTLTEIPIFTTNYDTILDEISEEFKGFKFIDGFYVAKRRVIRWNKNIFSKKRKGKCFLIFQLHGALNWRKTIGDDIIKIFEEEYYDPFRIIGRLIIPPGNFKNPYHREPYHTMHKYLNKYLLIVEKCVVIGFAFRDPHIRKIFIESMKNNKNLKIIIISPNAEKKILRNPLMREVKKIKNIDNGRIIPISSAFEKLDKNVKEFIELKIKTYKKNN